MAETMTAARERPILFSSPMIRAILDGTKTATRRIVTWPRGRRFCVPQMESARPDPGLGAGGYLKVRCEHHDCDHTVRCPCGSIGDRLWVRETWRPYNFVMPGESGILYAADMAKRSDGRAGPLWRMDTANNWRPSIHMPKWAARLWLEITDVRVERLQAISEADATAEGFQSSTHRWWQGFRRDEDGSRHMIEGGARPDGPPPEWMESPELQTMTTTAIERFRMLWHTLNAPRGFGSDVNPWVWAITFCRIDPPAPAG